VGPIAYGSHLRYWKIAPGHGGEAWAEQRDAGCIALGWNDTGDLRGLKNDEAIETKFRRCYRKRPDQLRRFYNDVQPGDGVVASSGEWVFGIGIVGEDGYRFDPRLTYQHAKPVGWTRTFWDPVSVEELRLPPKLEDKLRGRKPPRTIRELLPGEWNRFIKALNKIKDPYHDRRNVKGLMQAPRNEQELVVLFSKLDEILNMSITSVGTSFPDAMIRIEERRVWKTERAEFELLSSNFRRHGHFKKMEKLRRAGYWGREEPCYLICWKDDMDTRPSKRDVKIIELRKKVQRMPPA
jgi:hypothetical protein